VDRQQRVAEVRAVLRKAVVAKAVASEAGPPCRKCLYCGDEKPIPVCHHLVYLDPKYDPARGRFDGKSLRLITSARDDGGYCGPEALLFEPKSLLARARERLAGQRAHTVYAGIGMVVASFAAYWLF
jgi:hypothetical protein